MSVERLTSQEEVYVQRRAQGVNPSAAARMAGFNVTKTLIRDLTINPTINEAIAYLREAQRQVSLSEGAIEFTKNDATTLYLAAHAKAESAAEEIRAVDSLVKLHGLAEPEKREIKITSRGDMESMSDEDLLAMAGSELRLSPDQYKVIDDGEE